MLAFKTLYELKEYLQASGRIEPPDPVEGYNPWFPTKTMTRDTGFSNLIVILWTAHSLPASDRETEGCKYELEEDPSLEADIKEVLESLIPRAGGFLAPDDTHLKRIMDLVRKGFKCLR